MKPTRLMNLLLVIMVFASSSVSAHVLTVSPSQAVILPDDGSGVHKVAFLFDLSAMRQGLGRRIDEALLDWRLAGVSADRHSEYISFEILSSWTVLSILSGVPVQVADTPAAEWGIEPLDYQRNSGGFVRFDLASLVTDWMNGVRVNYGVVVATPDVDEVSLITQLQEAKLTVRYGFMR